MDISLKRWFTHRFLDLFQAQIRHYQTSAINRLFPSFSDLEKDAADFESCETKKMEALVDPEMEYSDFAEIIHDRTIDYYISLSNVRQGIVNLLTAGLFHLFELQMAQFVNSSVNKTNGKKDLFIRFEEILEDQKCLAVSLPHWDMLRNELRLVANTIKHGPGNSAEELVRSRPELFRPEHMKSDDTFASHAGSAISPLAGEGLFLTIDDFKIYATAIVEFWDAFSCWKE